MAKCLDMPEVKDLKKDKDMYVKSAYKPAIVGCIYAPAKPVEKTHCCDDSPTNTLPNITTKQNTQ